MKKTLIIRILTSAILLLLVFGNVYAFGNGFNNDMIQYQPDENISQLKTPFAKVFNSAVLILRILSVGGVIFAGVKYMFADASKKSEIKQSMVYLVIGMVIVFAASIVVQYIVAVAGEIMFGKAQTGI